MWRIQDREYLLWSKLLREKCLRQYFLAGTYFCGRLEELQNSQKLEPPKILCTRLSKLCNPNPLHLHTWPLIEKLSISKQYQDPITRSEQLPCVRVTVCSWKSLFLEQSWREFWISFKLHKPVSKTYRPKNDIFLPFNNLTFPFWYLILRVLS